MKGDKQSWIGTIPLFVVIVLLFLLVLIGSFCFSFYLFHNLLPLWLSISVCIVIAFVSFGLFLNIPLPRKRNNPVEDLDLKDKVTEGAWCSVYMKKGDPTRVVKQLFYCGWGHNDYRKHQAFVVGKEKVCGKWNPLVLWFLHNYMILYQIIGLKRRQKYEVGIEAIPETYKIDVFGLRYEQEYVSNELTVLNCPEDIEEQFK